MNLIKFLEATSSGREKHTFELAEILKNAVEQGEICSTLQHVKPLVSANLLESKQKGEVNDYAPVILVPTQKGNEIYKSMISYG